MDETKSIIIENDIHTVASNTDEYVICPNEVCSKHHVINSDDKIIICDCGTVSNISYLELFRSSNTEDMKQTAPKSPTDNPFEKNRMNLLKELDIQKIELPKLIN